MAAESNNTAQRTCPSCPPLNPLALFTHTLHLITPSTFLASFLNPLLINSHPHIPPCSLARLYSPVAGTSLQQPPFSCSGPAHKLTDSLHGPYQASAAPAGAAAATLCST
jgi:hypothetical protein